MILFEIEDKMHQANPSIFVNGRDGRNSSMLAYMTCLEYSALEVFLKQEFDNYPKEAWQRCCEYWESHLNLSPISYLLASYIRSTRLK